MLGNLSGWHMVIILAIVLLLFGAPKLPGLARSVGQSMRIFKSEVKTLNEDAPVDAPVATPVVSAPTVSTPSAAPATATPSQS